MLTPRKPREVTAAPVLFPTAIDVIGRRENGTLDVLLDLNKTDVTRINITIDQASVLVAKLAYKLNVGD